MTAADPINMEGSSEGFRVGIETPEILRAVGLIKWIMGLDESIAWFEGMVLTAFYLQRKGRTFVLKVLGYRQKGTGPKQHLIAYFDGGSPLECFNQFAHLTKYHRIRWYVDRYPPDKGD